MLPRMRLLLIHVNSFRSEMTERGRSPVFEEPESRVVETDEAILVLASVEKRDEEDLEGTVQAACQEIAKLASQLKVGTGYPQSLRAPVRGAVSSQNRCPSDAVLGRSARTGRAERFQNSVRLVQYARDKCERPPAFPGGPNRTF